MGESLVKGQKHLGKLKPFARKIKQALEDCEAYYVKTPGKNIYVYKLHD